MQIACCPFLWCWRTNSVVLMVCSDSVPAPSTKSSPEMSNDLRSNDLIMYRKLGNKNGNKFFEKKNSSTLLLKNL